MQAGSDAIGGVVNLVTRRPGGERRSEASVRGGSWNTWRGTAATSGTLRELEYAFAYDGFGTDGDFEFRRPALDVGGVVIEPDPRRRRRASTTPSETQAGLLALGHDLGDAAHVTVRDQLFYASRGQPGLDAGSVGAAGQRANAHERLTRNVLGATLEAAELTPARIDTTLDFWHRYQRTRFTDPDLVPSLGATIDTEDRNDELGTRLGLAREIPLFETLHRISLSLEAQRDTLDSNSFHDRGRNAGALVLQDDMGVIRGSPAHHPGRALGRHRGLRRPLAAAHRRDRDAAAVAAREGQSRALLPRARLRRAVLPGSRLPARQPRAASPSRRPTPTSARRSPRRASVR